MTTPACHVPWCTWDHSDGILSHSAEFGAWRLGAKATFEFYILQTPPDPPTFVVARYQAGKVPREWKLNHTQALDMADLLDLSDLLDSDKSRELAAALRRAAVALVCPPRPRLGR